MKRSKLYNLDRDESLLYFVTDPSKSSYGGTYTVEMDPAFVARFAKAERAYFNMQEELEARYRICQQKNKRGE